MTSKQNQRKHIFRAGLVTLILGSVVGLTGLFSAPAGAAVQPHQISICHATSSEKNPYSSPQPDKWQIISPNGHGWDADDIIPPFPAGTHGNKSWPAYPGLNWSPENQAIWARGCAAAPVPSGSVTLDKVTAGDGQPADTTAFDFTVSCQDASVTDGSPSVAPADPALTVATEVATGTTCTITETGAAGAASTSYSVNGSDDVSGSSVTVTITAEVPTVAVVFTNTYACASGSTADGQGGCTQQCVPTAENNQCTPCETGTPDGQGGCTQSCAPTVENNQCTPCDAGETADGAGNCTTVEDVILTPTPGGTQVEGVTQTRTPQVAAAELPRTGKATLPLVELGLGLVLLGLGALLAARDEAESA